MARKEMVRAWSSDTDIEGLTARVREVFDEWYIERVQAYARTMTSHAGRKVGDLFSLPDEMNEQRARRAPHTAHDAAREVMELADALYTRPVPSASGLDFGYRVVVAPGEGGSEIAFFCESGSDDLSARLEADGISRDCPSRASIVPASLTPAALANIENRRARHGIIHERWGTVISPPYSAASRAALAAH